MSQPDPTDRLAFFGRWAFFAGIVYALALVGIGRIVEWPDWLGAAVSFAGGWAVFRLIDWAAARRAPRPDPERTGRCGHTIDSWSRTAPLVCALPAGHAGWHRDDNRAEWSPDEITWKGTL